MHYYQETWSKYRISVKNLKWTDVTDKLKIPRNNSTHKKDHMKNYLSTYPATEMSILMSRDRFEQIWKYWHFSDNTKAEDNADKLHKIIYISGYLLSKFRTVYKPKQILTLNARMTL
jgi:hypothetical protein